MFTSNQKSFGIGIRLVDNFTAPARNAQSAMMALSNTQRNVLQSQLQMVRNISAGFTVAGMMGFRAMQNTVRYGASITGVMANVRAITEANTEEYNDMLQAVKKIGRETITTVEDVAGMFEQMGRAGLRPDQIMAMAEATNNLAIATKTNASATGEMLTNIMTAFNIQADGATRAADILTTATLRSNQTFTELHEALKYSSNEFRSLNVSLEEAAALTSVLANVGLKSSMGGTAMGNMLRRFAQMLGEFKTGRQESVIAKWGLKKEDVVGPDGQMRSMVDIFEKVQGAIRAQNQDVMSTLSDIMGAFNIRGARGLSPFLVDPKIGRNIREMTEALEQGNALKAAEIAAQMADNLSGDLKLFTSVVSDLKDSFTRSLEPLLRPLLWGLTRVMQGLSWFFQTWAGKIAAPLIAVTGAIVTLGALTIGLIAQFGLMQIGLAQIGLSLGVNTAAVIANTAATGANTAATGSNTMAQVGGGILGSRIRYGGTGPLAGLANLMGSMFGWKSGIKSFSKANFLKTGAGIPVLSNKGLMNKIGMNAATASSNLWKPRMFPAMGGMLGRGLGAGLTNPWVLGGIAAAGLAKAVYGKDLITSIGMGIHDLVLAPFSVVGTAAMGLANVLGIVSDERLAEFRNSMKESFNIYDPVDKSRFLRGSNQQINGSNNATRLPTGFYGSSGNQPITILVTLDGKTLTKEFKNLEEMDIKTSLTWQ